ncbi:chemotaxis protein CheD [Fervidibacter sacchari]|jgi:Chemotaxis protein; stimulates methylation of MCP proteins
MTVKERIVNLGEIVVTGDPETVLAVPGIGSCVVVCVFHPRTRLAGMAHIVLPSSQGRSEVSTKPFWFADIAVPHLLESMKMKGAIRPNCAIVGGAKILNFSLMATKTSVANIGELNVKSVLENLNGSVNLVAQIVGGNMGFSIRLQVANGILFVKDKEGQIRQINLSLP